MKIRPAALCDVPRMLEIYRPYVEQTAISFEYEPPTSAEFSARFAEVTAQFPWLVCEAGGKVAGYAYAGRVFGRMAYSWAAELSVYLAPEARGKGIGAALYGVLERMLAAQGYRTLYGVVTGENAASCRFHEACGYRKIAEMPDIGFKMGQWHAIVWYEKRLCAPDAPEKPPTPAPEMDWRGMEGLPF